MSRPLFWKIVEAVEAHNNYFTQKADACGIMGLDPLVKATLQPIQYNYWDWRVLYHFACQYRLLVLLRLAIRYLGKQVATCFQVPQQEGGNLLADLP
jgi:hypothetical protein